MGEVQQRVEGKMYIYGNGEQGIIQGGGGGGGIVHTTLKIYKLRTNIYIP